MKYLLAIVLLSIAHIESLKLLSKIEAMNAEALAVREAKASQQAKILSKVPHNILRDKSETLSKLLKREGVISIPNVLTPETCGTMKDFINRENDRLSDIVENGNEIESKVAAEMYYGEVNCRGVLKQYRRDMFLSPSSPIVKNALSEAMTTLSPLLHHITTLDGALHEVSSFIGDKGAPRQCVHADTIVLPCPQYPNAHMEPMYTVFVSLQDITDSQGHTIFYPKTHTSQTHCVWNEAQRQAKTPDFVKKLPVVMSQLKKGDVSIFDSRLLHCGMENTSLDRRLLFYFTVSEQKEWPLPNGLHGSNSILREDKGKYTVRDFLAS